MLEYQESVMAQNMKPNNTGCFSRTLFEKVLRILKELKYVFTLAKLFKSLWAYSQLLTSSSIHTSYKNFWKLVLKKSL